MRHLFLCVNVCFFHFGQFVVFIYNSFFFNLFRNIEEILAEKGEKIQKVTVKTEDLLAESSIESTSSNIELVLGENSSNIFKATVEKISDKNEK